MKTIKKAWHRKLTVIALMLITITSCQSIRLISEYDDITDKKVTELQEKSSEHFAKLERTIGTDESNYQHYVSFYDKAKADISTLKIRANAIEKNDIVIKQLVFVEDNMMILEELHKIGFKQSSEITPIKNAFNSAFTAIIKLQMALKRGEHYN